MARRRWGFRNYNAFLREAKRQHGVNHRQAQKLYRTMRQEYGRPMYGADVERYRERTEAVTVRKVLPKSYLPVGTEIELTATTRGNTPRRRKPETPAQRRARRREERDDDLD